MNNNFQSVCVPTTVPKVVDKPRRCPKCGKRMVLGEITKSLPDGTDIYLAAWICALPPWGCGHEEKVMP